MCLLLCCFGVLEVVEFVEFVVFEGGLVVVCWVVGNGYV